MRILEFTKAMLTYNPEEAVAHLCHVDERFRALIQDIGEFKLSVNRGTIFDGLLKSIVYQQLSGKAAATIYGRLLDRLPGKASERPHAILRLTDEEIRSAGVSRGKLAAIRDLAIKTTTGALPDRRKLRRLDDHQVIEALTTVRGVGRWTAEMILIFWLGRADVLPVGDLGVRRGYSLAFEKTPMPSPQELDQSGQHWKPFRSVAAWYLWRVADLAQGQDLW